MSTNDLRDPKNTKQIENFEKTLEKGPLAVVLIYADWCPHCQHFKPIWEQLMKTVGRKANMFSVNSEVLPATSMSHANIDGYPSVVVVDKGTQMREYPPEASQVAVYGKAAANSNAVPFLHDMEKMQNLIKGDVKKAMSGGSRRRRRRSYRKRSTRNHRH